MKKFFQNESGQGMVEYGLIIALIAIAVIAVLPFIGEKLEAIFTKVNNELGAATGA